MSARLITLVIAFSGLLPGVAIGADSLPVKVVTLSTTVRRGDNASLAVQTVANAACTIAVRYKTGPSTATGLIRKTADANGRVGWTWRVSTTATTGKWPITVACSADGRQGTLETTFFVH